jgi:hypothetical protein
MSWYNLGGKVQQQTGAVDLFWHDVLRIPNWPTQALAQQHPYTLNTAQAAGLGATVGAETQPVGQAVANDTSPQNITSGLGAIGDFFTKLGSRQTLVRLAEGLIGVALIIVALDKLMTNTPVGKVAHAAAKGAFLA